MPTFQNDCWMLTSRDALMPALYLCQNSEGLAEVQSPNGKIYTVSPAKVFSYTEGREMLYRRRAQELAAEGYEIKVRNDKTFRVVCVAKHGTEGGYIVRGDEHSATCTCKAYEKAGECKHQMGVTVLLWAKAAEARTRGWESGYTRYANLAAKVA